MSDLVRRFIVARLPPLVENGDVGNQPDPMRFYKQLESQGELTLDILKRIPEELDNAIKDLEEEVQRQGQLGKDPPAELTIACTSCGRSLKGLQT